MVKREFLRSEKKGQMKIQQTAFLIIAITVLFILVGLFFFVTQFSNLKEKASDIKEKRAIMKVSKIANSPEFSCGSSFGEDKSNCVDWSKLMYLKNHSDEYETFFRFSNIEVRKLFPNSSDNEKECTRENYPDCGKIKLYESEEGRPATNFVILCRKEASNSKNKNICSLAKMTIRYKEET